MGLGIIFLDTTLNTDQQRTEKFNYIILQIFCISKKNSIVTMPPMKLVKILFIYFQKYHTNTTQKIPNSGLTFLAVNFIFQLYPMEHIQSEYYVWVTWIKFSFLSVRVICFYLHSVLIWECFPVQSLLFMEFFWPFFWPISSFKILIICCHMLSNLSVHVSTLPFPSKIS